MITEPLPGLAGSGVWEVAHKSHPAALALADRHYSRRKPGSNQIGPPGRKLVLVSPAGDALWLSHWPNAELGLDGLDAYRCSIFRNEGPVLSSDLILAAMDLTVRLWGPTPRDGWVTWVDRAKVRATTNPGYCFLVAGWWRDDTYTPDRRRSSLVRLRA